MASPVLVYGWYGRGNVGDELMKQALSEMLSVHRLTPKFVDGINEFDVRDSSGVIFGGGSILQDMPDISPNACTMLFGDDHWKPLRPVFYVGVGGETAIHQFHEVLINASPVVAFRELDIPDLAYWLDPFEPDEQCGPPAHAPKGILVVPNVEVLPSHSDPHWMHASWEHFKNEFAQTLDVLVEKGHKLSFLSMCNAVKKNDNWVIHELMGRMSRRDNYPVYSTKDPLWVARLMRHHQVIITQRYHGIIMAESAGVPYLSISHHDKLKLTHPHRGHDVSYYAVQKDLLIETIESAMTMRIDPYRPPRAVYDDVISRIAAVIKEHG